MSIQRVFTFNDQLAFGAMTGDMNPLHVDLHWVRTVFPGQLVVHGMHALLWALEGLAVPRPQHAVLKAAFLKPIFLNEPVQAAREQGDVVVRVRGVPVIVAKFPDQAPLLPSAPAKPCPGGGSKSEGVVALPQGDAALVAAFPGIAAEWGVAALRGLAGLSTLVGMECPGLHSMFSEFCVELVADEAPLFFRTVRRDNRFGRVEMLVQGADLRGTVEAFDTAPRASGAAPDPVTPSPEEFQGQRPLIIGGSSGLGAATAELLAAGGARPVITYFGSPNAAQALAARIQNSGQCCDLLQLDVESPAEGLAKLSGMGWSGQEVYYFASPRIFRRRLEAYQAQDFHDFSRIYVDGFYEILVGLFAWVRPAALRVLYPSSVAVEPVLPDMFEYALAKSAGETLCRHMMSRFAGLEIIVERFPRIETRQTRSTLNVPAKSGSEVMLPIVRRIQERR